MRNFTGKTGIRVKIARAVFAIINPIISRAFNIVLCATMFNIGRKRGGGLYSYDYIRASSLELIADEINNRKLDGCAAEVGVFQGDFAKNINIVFPDRKLFLFDTFEGFSDKDIKIEDENNFSESVKKDFSAANIEMTLKKMKYPQNCIIKKGYFPDTAQGIDEKFVFVNIDVDLYLPIYNGLKFFYPRLQKGGYIFVHDYNSTLFKGVKEAVKKYAKENDLSYFPLSDHPGTVVFMK